MAKLVLGGLLVLHVCAAGAHAQPSEVQAEVAQPTAPQGGTPPAQAAPPAATGVAPAGGEAPAGATTQHGGALPPPPPPLPQQACVPACRQGYVCVAGQCVSACNPPCGPDEQCSAGACVSSGPAIADDDAAEDLGVVPGVEAHDGFMLRLAIGFGYGHARETTDASILGIEEVDISGMGGSFSVDLGGAPVENLVIHGRLTSYAVVDPEVSANGESLGTAEETSLSFILIGPGVTYYIMPVNLYLTAVAGASRARFETSSRDSISDYGFGLNFDVGKEWWVGDQWGLGAAGRFWYTTLSTEDAGADADLSFLGFAVLFSATYQ